MVSYDPNEVIPTLHVQAPTFACQSLLAPCSQKLNNLLLAYSRLNLIALGRFRLCSRAAVLKSEAISEVASAYL